MHAVYSLCAGIKGGISVSYSYSYIRSIYIRIAYILSLLKGLATNQYDIANWFMDARVIVYIYIAT